MDTLNKFIFGAFIFTFRPLRGGKLTNAVVSVCLSVCLSTKPGMVLRCE